MARWLKIACLLICALLWTGCSGILDGPEKGAKAWVESDLREMGVQSAEVEYRTVSNQNGFAKVHVSGKFYNGSGAWLVRGQGHEREAVIEVRLIGDEWRVPSQQNAILDLEFP